MTTTHWRRIKMAKPDHFREVEYSCCGSCAHRKLTYHHCSACGENDEYTCTKHDFLVSEYERAWYVCNDYEEEK